MSTRKQNNNAHALLMNTYLEGGGVLPLDSGAFKKWDDGSADPLEDILMARARKHREWAEEDAHHKAWLNGAEHRHGAHLNNDWAPGRSLVPA